MPAQRVSPSSLSIIRSSLLGGVVLFGVIIAWMSSTGSGPAAADSPFARPVFTWVFFALCAGAGAAIIVLRGRVERAPSFERRASTAIAAWAIGESVAILGGIHWLLTGSPTLYVIGALVFVVGLFTVSARE